MKLLSEKGCYVSKSKVNCGPCSFINLIGLKGNLALECKLSSVGRIKPFYASDYTSFLIWADKYKKDIQVYTASKSLNERMFKLMIYYEKIPSDKIERYKKEAKERHGKINWKFFEKVKIMRQPIEKINSFLDKGYKIAVLISDYYLKKNTNIPHWIVAFRKDGRNYLFMDSTKGIISLTKQELKKGFDLNKKNGFYPQLIVFKEQN